MQSRKKKLNARQRAAPKLSRNKKSNRKSETDHARYHLNLDDEPPSH